ncbi:MupA/Atu3671 family FMN-dependent luciferase-like monooxygenase [Plantactinospora sp. ZYX-F-223]|uniref:MupA/Atu3671 family FMN-dependent luciferase-like monooxygenase n=1 Tax=Plantactinospora sp. ZYX-F-223 TaxID=3144103 RepID=UPI0031FBD35C
MVDLLRWRSEAQPETVGYTFLRSGAEDIATYAELDRRARSVAAALQDVCGRGERAMLLLAPGLDYVAAFFGCLYAGVVAVPAYPPRRVAQDRNAARLAAVVDDAAPSAVLTTTDLVGRMDSLVARATPRPALISVDEVTAAAEHRWRPAGVGAADVAFLQYTSGSTAMPKGVQVTHRNLLSNGADIEHLFGLDAESKTVSWLPLYHDMGLIGGILQPLYTGYPVLFMAPGDFARDPFAWLDAISRSAASVSGGPSFAYDLCVRRVTPEQVALLDLSSWRVAFNGAEPVKAEVLDRFVDMFAPAGFRRSAFYPCYGLAENTLIATGGGGRKPPVVRRSLVADSQPLVSCGRPSQRQRVLIVDPETRTPCPDGVEGEIWISGPSVAQGYWRRPGETAVTFAGRLAGSEDGPFLRTGDLGLMEDGELFVTGRIKDLIIIRGINHHPQDVEQTVAGAHEALQPNGGAAVVVETESGQRLVILHEISPRCPDSSLDEVAESIRATVGQVHELTVHAVVLLRSGALPRTSSGKLRRHAARQGFLTGELVARSRHTFDPAQLSHQAPAPDRSAAVDHPARRHLVEEFVRSHVAACTGCLPAQVSLDRPGPAAGLDSVGLVQLQHAIERHFNVEVSAEHVHGAKLVDLARTVAQAAAAADVDAPGGARVDAEQPLTYGQRAMWFLDQLIDTEGVYNLAGAARLKGAIDVAAVREALRLLALRHAVLRTTFAVRPDGPVQITHPEPPTQLRHRELSDWSPEALDREIAAAVHQPLSLTGGPLTWFHLWTGEGRDPLIVLVAHHIVSDFWSLAFMLKEFAELYSAIVAGERVTAPAGSSYAAYVAWQARYLESQAGQESAEYWMRQLSGELPRLSLPTDRPRPAVPSYRGDSHRFMLDRVLAERLQALARETGETLYTVLLSAFQVFLHRYTGQTDILVGSPASARSRAAFAATLGYFVNPVVLRGDLVGNPSFRSVLEQFSRKVPEALAHQDYPFALLAERLQPVRDAGRSPVFQTMFIYQQSPLNDCAGLGMLAVGQPCPPFEIAGLRFEPVPVPVRTAQFDLTLIMAEMDGQLAGAIQYRTDLFDGDTVERMAEHFTALLRAIVDDPDEPVGYLPMLDGDARRRVLDEWNDTAAGYPDDACVHDRIAITARAQPDAVAVVCGASQMTYQELDERADAVAAQLAGHGVSAEARVGICAERSLDLIVGLLGILKAGGAYVPLDPAYPSERLGAVLDDADVSILLTQSHLTARLPSLRAPVLYLDTPPGGHRAGVAPPDRPMAPVPDNAAYVLYTSGSTGKPKGVVVSHRNVVNLFAGMDRRIGCGPQDTLLAVTSVAFDISVLEIFWTLTRGARVLLADDRMVARRGGSATAPARRPVDFSLFYFASASRSNADDKYRLVLEGARFADRHDFRAVWTPERHFHEFGGLYPNPAVLSAAIAAVTERVQIRAGSVVLPLHSPLRVAEEWSVVDNISRGRAGVAFASGWHADDFAFFPERYADRKRWMNDGIDAVRTLWRGGSIDVVGGGGNTIEARVFPAPVQPDLPIWLTAAGSPDTFARAGALGANVLTHLLGQTVAQVAENIRLYREARRRHGHDPETGVVTLMLHAFLGEDREAVHRLVRQPFGEYLLSSVGLIENLVRSLNLPLDLASMNESDKDALLAFAVDRYFDSSAMFGSVDDAQAMVRTVRDHGVDEIACLIDFGLPADVVLAGLPKLAELRQRCLPDPSDQGVGPLLADQLAAFPPSMLQLTPSMMQMLRLDPAVMAGLRSLRVLMLGGEVLPTAMVRELSRLLPADLVNMYGPTETTIWSSTHSIGEADGAVPIGRPIANTEMYVLNPMMVPVPPGVVGELFIGGLGVSRGYWREPGLTAARFVPDPFSGRCGARLYRTGDMVRQHKDGTFQFLGRMDRQVKLHGFRIEPAEVEMALGRLDNVREAVAVVRSDGTGDPRLVGYVVPDHQPGPTAAQLRSALAQQLPHYLIPSSFVTLTEVPLTVNGKVDVNALPAPDAGGVATGVPPATELERQIAAVWSDVLQLDTVGIHDNFFDLGGHSLLMAQVHARLRLVVGADLPMIRLLEYPTISALAAFLSREQALPPSFRPSEERARLQRTSRRRGQPAPEGEAGT